MRNAELCGADAPQGSPSGSEGAAQALQGAVQSTAREQHSMLQVGEAVGFAEGC